MREGAATRLQAAERGRNARANSPTRDSLIAKAFESADIDDGGRRHQRTVLAYLVRLFFAGLTVDARLLRDAIGDDAMAVLFLDEGGLGVLERHPLDQVHERGRRRRRGGRAKRQRPRESSVRKRSV